MAQTRVLQRRIRSVKNAKQITKESFRLLNNATWSPDGSALTKREREAGHLPAGYEYRLPSEAEWEYASRAGSTNLFSFGNDVASEQSIDLVIINL